ncbi:MAG: 1-acyl-sn-glycerol-3-phosphate acyltransferase [Corynebacteriales bacterium]|nr:1-acyl-sn-glycerol-3-phosphate acyltransferase [Mycobacteriales bacterium]
MTSLKSATYRREMQRVAYIAARILTRFEVTGELAPHDGPRIFAANHIGSFDTFALLATFHKMGVTPRIMAGERFFTGRLGKYPRRADYLPVPSTEDPQRRISAFYCTVTALQDGDDVAIFPEGRISLDPELWPEKPYTGVGRLAPAVTKGGGRTPEIVPVTQWGAQNVFPVPNSKATHPRSKVRWLGRAAYNIARRPRVRVHVGPSMNKEVTSGQLSPRQSANQVMEHITGELVRMRHGEPAIPCGADRRKRTDPSRRLITHPRGR